METFWFIVIAFFWTGFFVLEGFDFGVGALHRVVGKTDFEQRVAINSIGPFWDGNEVWLIVAGAGTFAAFPSWYATMFSALYAALIIVLVALIIRGLSFEWRGKDSRRRWKQTWSWALTIGSWALPVLFGVALGDLLHGLPINQSGDFTGNVLDLLTPYGIWVGITFLALSLAHGSVFLMLKTTGVVRDRAARLAGPLTWIAAAATLGYTIWTHVLTHRGLLLDPVQGIAILASVGGAWAVRDRHVGSAFGATTVAIGAAVGSLFLNLYPNVMVSTTNASYNLTVSNAASGSYALTTMTVVAVLFAPLVLAYQGWSYYVFRARVTGPEAAGAPEPLAPKS